MALTLMQGHNGLAEEKVQRWIISTTKQAINMRARLNSVLLDLDLKQLYGLTSMLGCVAGEDAALLVQHFLRPGRSRLQLNTQK